MNVYKWLDIGGRKYGLVSEFKTENVIGLLINSGKPNPTHKEIIVEYDKRAGLIVDINLEKVETGKFYDFKKNANTHKYRNT